MRVVDRAQRAGRDRCGGVALWTHGRKGLGERDVTTSCRLRDLSTTPGMRGVETLTRGNALCAHRRCKAWRQSASEPACREAAASVLPRRTASRNAADPEAAQGCGPSALPLGYLGIHRFAVLGLAGYAEATALRQAGWWADWRGYASSIDALTE